MTERDEELARRLAEIEVPEHGPEFWSDLRARTSTSSGPRAERQFVENEEPVVLDERRRPAPRAWLAAAALVVLALVAVGLLVDRGTDDEADVTTDPTPPTAPTTEPTEPDDGTAPAGPLRPDGDPIERGQGRVVAVDPAGEFLYVADEDADGEPGCEGHPSPVLVVQPIDGGQRREVLSPGASSATGAYHVRFGPAGELAIVMQCEGFEARIVTGTLAPDGTLADPTELTIPDLDLDRDVDGILDLEFRSAGTLVAVTRSIDQNGIEHRHLYEFPTEPSEVTDLGVDDVVGVDVTADGRLATASSDGIVRLDGEVVGEVADVVDLATSRDGERLFAVQAGTDGPGVVAIHPRSGDHAVATNLPAASVVPVDSEEALVVTGTGPWQLRSVRFVPGASEPATELVLDAVQPLGAVLTPDGSRLFTQLSVSGELVVVEQRLTR